MAYSGNNPPTQVAINDMLSSLNGNDQVTKGCRFIVRINPQGLLSRLSYFNDISKSMIFACDSAEFPGRGFQVTEMRYYGPKQLTPGNTTYGDGVTLSFLVRSNTFERQFFDDWCQCLSDRMLCRAGEHGIDFASPPVELAACEHGIGALVDYIVYFAAESV